MKNWFLNKKLRKLLEEYQHGFYRELEKEYDEFCDALSPDLRGKSNYPWLLWRGFNESNNQYDGDWQFCKSVEEAKEYFERKKEVALAEMERMKSDTIKFWKKCCENKEKLNALVDNCPLFIKISQLDGTCPPEYKMCYEFKNPSNGVYYLYTFGTKNQCGGTIRIDYTRDSVEKMTEEEFENHYIIGRMKCSNFTDEQEAIDYDNKIRRLFHGQREII